jgi:hypothetical protein
VTTSLGTTELAEIQVLLMDAKPYCVPNDERSRVEGYDGNNSFSRDRLFGRGNKGSGTRG